MNNANLTTLHAEDLQWIVHRLPRAVRKQMQINPKIYLAGGFIRSCIAREPVNDVDLFAPSEDVAMSVALQLADADPRRLHKTANALTIRQTKPTVQIVHRWTYTDPHDLIRDFDFTIAGAVIWHEGGEWRSACVARYYSDLAAKRLVYMAPDREEEPGGSMLRILKFMGRGYRIPLDSLAGVVARLAAAVPNEAWGVGEGEVAKCITGLLYEVDPALDDLDTPHIHPEHR